MKIRDLEKKKKESTQMNFKNKRKGYKCGDSFVVRTTFLVNC